MLKCDIISKQPGEAGRPCFITELTRDSSNYTNTRPITWPSLSDPCKVPCAVRQSINFPFRRQPRCTRSRQWAWHVYLQSATRTQTKRRKTEVFRNEVAAGWSPERGTSWFTVWPPGNGALPRLNLPVKTGTYHEDGKSLEQRRQPQHGPSNACLYVEQDCSHALLQEICVMHYLLAIVMQAHEGLLSEKTQHFWFSDTSFYISTTTIQPLLHSFMDFKWGALENAHRNTENQWGVYLKPQLTC